MRLNSFMALATVASVVGVVSSTTIGSMSVAHHYFQGGGVQGSRPGGARMEMTAQLTVDEGPPPMALMLLSELPNAPPAASGELRAQSLIVPGFGSEPVTEQSLGFGDSGGEGFGQGDLAPGQGQAALAGAAITQGAPPNTGQPPGNPPAGAQPFGAPQLPGGSPSGDNFGPVFPPVSAPGPFTPPPVAPPPVVPPFKPPSPPVFPPPVLPPPPSNIVSPPGQVGGPPPSAIPEPGTWSILVLGLGLAGAAMRRRQAALAREPRQAVA